MWGLLRSVLSGLLDGIPTGDPLLDEDEVDERAEVRAFDYGHLSSRGPDDYQLSNSDSAREDPA